MSNKLNPYISFNGNAREALEFYKAAFGGVVTMSTFKEGGMTQDPSMADKIMHAQLVTNNGMTLMLSDTPPGMPHNPGGSISISLSGDNEEELRGYWNALSKGARVAVALDKAPWGDTFGMFTDMFGVSWLVNIASKKS